MTRDEEKVLRFKQQRSKEAIGLAMEARWQDAVAVNREIIESFPEDVDTYNRLGRAYMELGQYTASREAYQRAVQIDPYNAIAARNLRRLNDLKDTEGAVIETDRVDPQHFIEEIGKAGVVALADLVSKEDRARLVAGDKVYLKVSGSALVVESGRGEYVGKVDSKYAPRLIRLILGGNQYSASVVKSTADSMTVMIRETYQHPSQAGKLSFPPKGMEEFRPYASDKLLKLEPEEGEEEDSGYTIIGGSEIEVLPDESLGVDDDMDSENE
jgi:hypothetical protein